MNDYENIKYFTFENQIPDGRKNFIRNVYLTLFIMIVLTICFYFYYKDSSDETGQ